MGVNWSTNRRAICSGTNIARDVPSMLMRASALTLPPTLVPPWHLDLNTPLSSLVSGGATTTFVCARTLAEMSI